MRSVTSFRSTPQGSTLDERVHAVISELALAAQAEAGGAPVDDAIDLALVRGAEAASCKARRKADRPEAAREAPEADLPGIRCAAGGHANNCCAGSGGASPPPQICGGEDDRLIGTSVGIEAVVHHARVVCTTDTMQTARNAFIPAPVASQMPHGMSMMPIEFASSEGDEIDDACVGVGGGSLEVVSPSTPIKRDHPILIDDQFLLFASTTISEFCTELKRRVPRAEVLPSTMRAGTVLLAAFRLQDTARAAEVASTCEGSRVFALAAFSVAAKFLGCRPTTPMAALTALVAKVDAKALSAAELELCCTLEWNVSRVFREARCF